MNSGYEGDVFSFFQECVQSMDASGWNNFRRTHRKQKITMEGQNFSEITVNEFNLKGIYFHHCNFSQSNFINCTFDQCQMEELQAFGTRFEQCSFVSANMQKGNYVTCNFIESDLRYANCSYSTIHQSFLVKCICENGQYFHVSLFDTCLFGSHFAYCDFRQSDIQNVQIHHADFTGIKVDGDTIFWDCYYDKGTNFTGVGLASCRIEPVLLSSFQCNIRRIWWEQWYQSKKMQMAESLRNIRQHPLRNLYQILGIAGAAIMNFFVKIFWWITDYGSSTVRLILCFLITTLGFSILYTIFPTLTNDPILAGAGPLLLKFIRSFYFSIIVMTGLGFGEIHASSSSYMGHIIIISQSLTGYILLGAFLVRIGILFQGEFPVASIRKKSKNGPCEVEEDKDKHNKNQQ